MTEVSILGASGYAGGELLRLLLGHSEVNVKQVISRSNAGSYVNAVHPNLRGVTDLRFISEEALEECDLLFCCLPHGELTHRIGSLDGIAQRIVDLSADFRLDDPEVYKRWYGHDHAAPEWLNRFVYGLPELRRKQIAEASYISGVGCNATASNFALAPLARAGLIERAIVDLKVGSSEGGRKAGSSSHHPERSGSLRSFSPSGHRHQAEVEQELGDFLLSMSVTSVERVRGILCTAHIFTTEPIEDRELWRLYREMYGDEPFVRLFRSRAGLYRYPDPKYLCGSNFADVGFERDASGGRVVVISAIDNLMKGAAGTAVQAMNLMFGWPETAGLEFPGLHPV